MASVTHNGKQFMLTVGLLVCVIYLYTVVAFNFSETTTTRVKTERMTGSARTCFLASISICKKPLVEPFLIATLATLVSELEAESVTKWTHQEKTISSLDSPSISPFSSSSLLSFSLLFR